MKSNCMKGEWVRRSVITLFLITLLIILFTIFAIMNIGEQKVMAAVNGPCDIYADGGTPCVAAHSTVRALFGSYNGNLYQVRRSSDNTTKDIPVLTTGGYANSAVQDSFCAGTKCTISIIYDQSGKGNHLTVTPPGGWLEHGGTEANASAAKIIAGGHTVYGVYTTGSFDAAIGGVGYRNNKTTGVATGDQPEGIYMVASGKHYNQWCCFDYGNAETNNLDNGNATMETVYFGNSTQWGHGSGSGPWVMADLENGLFAGGTLVNNNNTPIIADYITGMVKGKSGNSYAIRGGDATKGTLKTMYNGPRPSGYSPMKKEGAIILGVGGDNSHTGEGTFFEGAITNGYPSDETENAIQDNIIAAGYGSLVTPVPTATPGPISAFSQIEAENYSSQSGIQTETCNEGGLDVGFIENNDYIAFTNIDFSSGAATFQARVSSATSGGNIEIRLDSVTGSSIGTCPVSATGDWQTWTTVNCNVSSVSGKHNLYLVFTGASGYLFNINWFKFAVGSTPTPTSIGLKGDVNSDGSVTIVDALLVAQYTVGLNPSGFIPANADVNCDGTIDIVDALLISQYTVGLINKFC